VKPGMTTAKPQPVAWFSTTAHWADRTFSELINYRPSTADEGGVLHKPPGWHYPVCLKHKGRAGCICKNLARRKTADCYALCYTDDNAKAKSVSSVSQEITVLKLNSGRRHHTFKSGNASKRKRSTPFYRSNSAGRQKRA